ncbi:MAG: hypothetical protein ACK4SS_03035, partial [Cypionkella sp.]
MRSISKHSITKHRPKMSLSEIVTMAAAAAKAAGRDTGEITLIAVSKLQPIDRLRAVLVAGHLHFGENYVQES